jgi:ribosomal protein S18 acetylase RimI-like enzyme
VKVLRLGPGDTARLLAARELFDRPPTEESARAYLADDRNVVFLAVDGPRPIGFVRGTSLRQLGSGRPQMFLYEIGVIASHRRRGVGKSLVSALLEHCRAQGYEEMFVLTDPANTAAVSLYRSTGATTETPADRMFVYRLVP